MQLTDDAALGLSESVGVSDTVLCSQMALSAQPLCPVNPPSVVRPRATGYTLTLAFNTHWQRPGGLAPTHPVCTNTRVSVCVSCKQIYVHLNKSFKCGNKSGSLFPLEKQGVLAAPRGCSVHHNTLPMCRTSSGVNVTKID